jgi:hypothetical protein
VNRPVMQHHVRSRPDPSEVRDSSKLPSHRPRAKLIARCPQVPARCRTAALDRRAGRCRWMNRAARSVPTICQCRCLARHWRRRRPRRAPRPARQPSWRHGQARPMSPPAADRIPGNQSDSQWRRARCRFPARVLHERRHRTATMPGGLAPSRQPGHWLLKGRGRLHRHRLDASSSPHRMVAAKMLPAAQIANWQRPNPCPMRSPTILQPLAIHHREAHRWISCHRHRLDCWTHPPHRIAVPPRWTHPPAIRRRPRVQLVHPAISRRLREPDRMATRHLVAGRQGPALRLPVRVRPQRPPDPRSPQVGAGRPRQDVQCPLAWPHRRRRPCRWSHPAPNRQPATQLVRRPSDRNCRRRRPRSRCADRHPDRHVRCNCARHPGAWPCWG